MRRRQNVKIGQYFIHKVRYLAAYFLQHVLCPWYFKFNTACSSATWWLSTVFSESGACLLSDNSVVRFVSRHSVWCGRVSSPFGSNVFTVASDIALTLMTYCLLHLPISSHVVELLTLNRQARCKWCWNYCSSAMVISRLIALAFLLLLVRLAWLTVHVLVKFCTCVCTLSTIS